MRTSLPNHRLKALPHPPSDNQSAINSLFILFPKLFGEATLNKEAISLLYGQTPSADASADVEYT